MYNTGPYLSGLKPRGKFRMLQEYLRCVATYRYNSSFTRFPPVHLMALNLLTR